MTAKLDGRLALPSFCDSRFQPIARVQIRNSRQPHSFHVDEDVGRQVVQPVDETIALYAIEPFYLHRLELAGRLNKGVAVGSLAGTGYRTHSAGQCFAEVDRKNFYSLKAALLLLDQRFDDGAFGQASAVMFAKD